MIDSIKKWFTVAKPEPVAKDITTQMGCHFEEVDELIQGIKAPTVTPVHQLATALKTLAPEDAEGVIQTLDHVATLDALCDQIVTAIGLAHFLGYDIEGAVDEVNKSNWSKFEDGRVLLDNNGKIKKGRDYFPPDLKNFVNR